MNTEKPHDIIDLDALMEKPKREREKYVPIPREAIPELQAMTVEERAAWLEANSPSEFDLQRFLRAQEKRERKAAKRAQETPDEAE